MTLIQSLLHLTNFRSPFLRTLVPSVSAAFAIQAAFAIPSILAESERFYDFSGSLTFLSVTVLSLYLPSIRARYAATALDGARDVASRAALPSLFAPFSSPGGMAALNWRQVVLSGAVAFWASRLGAYLFQRVLADGKDSRFDKIKKSPPKFAVAFFAQATWVSLCLMPVIAVNAIPAAAFAALPPVKLTDIIGLLIYAGGFSFEIIADRQKSKWQAEKKAKVHDEEFLTKGLWSRSRFPNYFGEISLWTGIATTSVGLLATRPIQSSLGLAFGLPGLLTAAGISYVSPAFVSFLLTKVSGIPLSETKYDKKFGDRKDYQQWKQNTPRLFPKLW
ncbi:hypothetical protein F5X68DRAFT_172425 [Plectosphaerella plurivora]|uniref:Steroid 5-alpha reductase C-terminal domain-containing protein n=1 Tax=Plectosphaerella plurivora TaxID=936078 RepID=A0A9P8V8Q9_9PEZI|nr:hypothetical protein F5X68DRAFT_172425 [Plectosphaerella plurivora]